MRFVHNDDDKKLTKGYKRYFGFLFCTLHPCWINAYMYMYVYVYVYVNVNMYVNVHAYINAECMLGSSCCLPPPPPLPQEKQDHLRSRMGVGAGQQIWSYPLQICASL